MAKIQLFSPATILLLNIFGRTKATFIEGLANTLQELINVAGSGPYDGIHPEAMMNTLEIAKYYGYFAQKYDVLTHDGYILEIHRIPFGKFNSTRHRPPILLQHGVLGSSSSWLLNKDESLAFLLADEGYDVWLGNVRGNTYCKRHMHMTSKDIRFWEFNLDDHAHGDLPAIIDFILKVTACDKLTYVGYSLGSTIGTLLLAGSPQYNSKVKLAALLAPVVYGRFVKNPLRLIGVHFKEIKEWYGALGTKEIRFQLPLVKKGILSVCTDYPGVILCDAMLSIIGGYDEQQLDLERAHVYVAHLTGESTLNIVEHFSTMFTMNKVVYFDYGPKDNLHKYGQIQPPSYNLSKITCTTAIYYGYMDLYTDQKDVQRLANEITGLKSLELVPYDLWSHTDFVIARNAKEYLYDRLIEYMKKIN